MLFDGLHKFDHVNGSVVIGIQMLHDGKYVEFGERNACECADGLAQFPMGDALRTIGIDFVEHLGDVQIFECVQQRSEGISMVLMLIRNIRNVIDIVHFLRVISGHIFRVLWLVVFLRRFLFFEIHVIRLRHNSRRLLMNLIGLFFLIGIIFSDV